MIFPDIFQRFFLRFKTFDFQQYGSVHLILFHQIPELLPVDPSPPHRQMQVILQIVVIDMHVPDIRSRLLHPSGQIFRVPESGRMRVIQTDPETPKRRHPPAQSRQTFPVRLKHIFQIDFPSGEIFQNLFPESCVGFQPVLQIGFLTVIPQKPGVEDDSSHAQLLRRLHRLIDPLSGNPAYPWILAVHRDIEKRSMQGIL